MKVGHRVAKAAGKMMSGVRAGDEKLAIQKEHEPRTLHVTTTAFADGGPIPERYAGTDGSTPYLAWSGVPAETKELVLLCEDPDAPMPKPFVHWVVYGLSPEVTSVGGPAATGGLTEGKNSTGKIGYMGPKPPPGHGVHHYHFELFALDAPLELGPGADRDAVVRAMHGHVRASGEVVGTFEAI